MSLEQSTNLTYIINLLFSWIVSLKFSSLYLKKKKKPQIFSSPTAENMTAPGGNMAEEAGN